MQKVLVCGTQMPKLSYVVLFFVDRASNYAYIYCKSHEIGNKIDHVTILDIQELMNAL